MKEEVGPMRTMQAGWNPGCPRGSGVLVLVLLCLFAAPVFAEGVELALLPAVAEVQPEEIFDLEIAIPAAGDSLNGYETTIEFDPAVLDFIELSPRSLQEGELMTSACSTRWHLFNETNGTITISHILLCAGVKVAGPGVLYRLRFQAHDTTAVTSVVFSALEVYDAGNYVTPVVSHDAEVHIGNVTAVPEAVRGFGLRPPVPNPFRSSVQFEFGAGRDGPARLDVYSVTGRLVRRLWTGALDGGRTRRIGWDGRDDAGRRLGAGVYLIRLAGPDGPRTSRVVLLP